MPKPPRSRKYSTTNIDPKMLDWLKILAATYKISNKDMLTLLIKEAYTEHDFYKNYRGEEI